MPETKWKPIASSPLSSTDYTKRKDAKIRTPGIEAELLEVHWLSGILAARDRATISTPNWNGSQQNEEEEQPSLMRFKTGALRPGVYLTAGEGKHELAIKIRVTKNSVTQHTSIKGTLGQLRFVGTLPKPPGEHTVTLKIENPPTVCEHFEGDADWFIDAGTDGIKPLNRKTRLEVFFIVGRPAQFFRGGVWIEALRLAFKKARINGISSPSQIAAAITKYCHTGHGMLYDTKKGASHFSALNIGGSTFQLMSYIRKKGDQGPVVNCFDQAAAVQAFCGAVGVSLDWYYLSPFGYIRKTNLVGVGPCNNPFFTSKGGTAVTNYAPPTRTGFGNHAFVGFFNKIFDACAGPHTGTGTLRQYITSSIDLEVTVPIVAPGHTKEQYIRLLEDSPNPLRGLSGVA